VVLSNYERKRTIRGAKAILVRIENTLFEEIAAVVLVSMLFKALGGFLDLEEDGSGRAGVPHSGLVPHVGDSRLDGGYIGSSVGIDDGTSLLLGVGEVDGDGLGRSEVSVSSCQYTSYAGRGDPSHTRWLGETEVVVGRVEVGNADRLVIRSLAALGEHSLEEVVIQSQIGSGGGRGGDHGTVLEGGEGVIDQILGGPRNLDLGTGDGVSYPLHGLRASCGSLLNGKVVSVLDQEGDITGVRDVNDKGITHLEKVLARKT